MDGFEKFIDTNNVLSEAEADPITKGEALKQIRQMVTNLQAERDKEKPWSRKYVLLNAQLRRLYQVIAIVDSIKKI